MLKKKLKSKEKLTNLFNQLNIKKNDNLIFHSNLAGLHQFEGKLEKKKIQLFFKIYFKLHRKKRYAAYSYL